MKTFFDAVRKQPFDGLTQGQVDGMETLHSLREKWNKKQGDLKISDEQFAYILSTCYHETAHTMQPITEYGGKSYFMDRYDPSGSKPHIAKALGNTEVGDGYKFRGRGYPQLTGRTNYEKASKIVGVDLLENPDLALEPEYAAPIFFDGMMRGWYTGKALGDYVNGSKKDYRNARRVVNGLDKADTIARIALQFEHALKKQAKAPDPVEHKRVVADTVTPAQTKEPPLPDPKLDAVTVQTEKPLVGTPDNLVQISKPTILHEAASIIKEDQSKQDNMVDVAAKAVGVPTFIARPVIKKALPFLIDQIL